MSSKVSSHFKAGKDRASDAQNKKSGSSARAPLQQIDSSSHADAPAGTDMDIDANERLLRQFDLSTKYGPCIGMTRLERWERAQEFGLQPPQDVLQLLQRLSTDSSKHKCLWEGRV